MSRRFYCGNDVERGGNSGIAGHGGVRDVYWFIRVIIDISEWN